MVHYRSSREKHIAQNQQTHRLRHRGAGAPGGESGSGLQCRRRGQCDRHRASNRQQVIEVSCSRGPAGFHARCERRISIVAGPRRDQCGRCDRRARRAGFDHRVQRRRQPAQGGRRTPQQLHAFERYGSALGRRRVLPVVATPPILIPDLTSFCFNNWAAFFGGLDTYTL